MTMPIPWMIVMQTATRAHLQVPERFRAKPIIMQDRSTEVTQNAAYGGRVCDALGETKG